MISVVILTYNNKKTIRQVLESLKNFNEVIIYDTGSSDETLSIVKEFQNVKVFFGNLEGFGPTRNYAAQLATNDWILSIDSDEVLSSQLKDEILKESLQENTIYSLPFHNYYNGRHIKCAGWYPESHIRLYNKKKTAFSTNLVHEGVISQGMHIKKFKNPINHYSYSCISDFLIKMQSYSELFVKQNVNKKKSSPLIALLHGSAAFFKSFILKRGFLGGYEGMLISFYNAHTSFYKYLKLYEANKKGKKCS